MTCQEYLYFVRADLWRHGGANGGAALLRAVLFGEGASYSFWMRTCAFLRSKALTKWTLFPFAKLMYRRSCIAFGVWIPYSVRVGPGLHIAHASCIFVNENALIGRNCTICQGVTLGVRNRGEKAGTPILGDNVYIGPGAKIIGGVRVGNNVAIGANAVVVEDVPNNAVVVGIPGRVISWAGSEGYVTHTEYE